MDDLRASKDADAKMANVTDETKQGQKVTRKEGSGEGGWGKGQFLELGDGPISISNDSTLHKRHHLDAPQTKTLFPRE